jgi:ABC-type antimicrobial peptide transport system permease subunit
LRGRGFLPSDTANAPRVAVVNEQFAKHYWPGVDAMGQHFRLDSRAGTPVEIVGVAKTITYVPNTNTPTDYVYMPLTQHPVPQMVLMLRSNGDPLQLLPALRDVVRAIDPNLPILDARSYADYYQNKTVNGGRVASEMVSAMGVLGLLLAIAGLYGLVAYNVNRRTREIGIRMAIGAGRADVLRMVMRQGVVLVGMGTAIGLAMGLAVERLIISMVFDSGGVDLVAYATVVPAMFLATMLAAYVPARRAAQIDPTQALRYE